MGCWMSSGNWTYDGALLVRAVRVERAHGARARRGGLRAVDSPFQALAGTQSNPFGSALRSSAEGTAGVHRDLLLDFTEGTEFEMRRRPTRGPRSPASVPRRELARPSGHLSCYLTSKKSSHTAGFEASPTTSDWNRQFIESRSAKLPVEFKRSQRAVHRCSSSQTVWELEKAMNDHEATSETGRLSPHSWWLMSSFADGTGRNRAWR